MIIYELSCSEGHRFEGWFASAEDFTRQSESELVRCPVCDDAEVARVPSARIHVGRSEADVAPIRRREPANPPVADTAANDLMAGLPPELVRKLRAAVRDTENVGRRFPEEARKIHYAEVPPRPIRGQASAEEAAEMREEGIEFAALPGFLTRDTH
jgi:hypothetical protein